MTWASCGGPAHDPDRLDGNPTAQQCQDCDPRPCGTCGGTDHPTTPCACWTSLATLAPADVKALFAADGWTGTPGRAPHTMTTDDARVSRPEMCLDTDWTGYYEGVGESTAPEEPTMATTEATATFTAQLATARAAYHTALNHTKPMDADLAATLQARYPEAFAEMEAKVAAIAATLPALKATYDALDADACWRCHGTGDYDAPTSRYKGGRPICFTCGGSGKTTAH